MLEQNIPNKNLYVLLIITYLYVNVLLKCIWEWRLNQIISSNNLRTLYSVLEIASFPFNGLFRQLKAHGEGHGKMVV